MGRARDLADKAAISYATQAAFNALPVRSEYVSPQQTITAGALLTLAHGLGAVPRLVSLTLVCVTADAGYSVGDEVEIVTTNGVDTNASTRGLSLRKNATNLFIRFNTQATPLTVIPSAGGANVTITIANWRLVARALA